MKPLIPIFDAEFEGMAFEKVTLRELELVRERLVQQILKDMTPHEKQFLSSFHAGNPDWALLGLGDLGYLPALQWKLFNLEKMVGHKRQNQAQALQDVLDV